MPARRKLIFHDRKAPDVLTEASGSPKPKILNVEYSELKVGKNKSTRFRFSLFGAQGCKNKRLYVVGSEVGSEWWVRGIKTDNTYIDLIDVMRRSGRRGVVQTLRRVQHMKRRICVCRYPSDPM